jgi:hypothetical protein
VYGDGLRLMPHDPLVVGLKQQTDKSCEQIQTETAVSHRLACSTWRQ